MIIMFIWKDKQPWITNRILKKNNKVEGLKLVDFKAFYKATWLRWCGIGKGINVDQGKVTVYKYVLYPLSISTSFKYFWFYLFWPLCLQS